MKRRLLKAIIDKKDKKIEFGIITDLENAESCIFENNKSLRVSFQRGGGVFAWMYNTSTVVNCVFYDNSAVYRGDVAYNVDNLVIKNSILIGGSNSKVYQNVGDYLTIDYS